MSIYDNNPPIWVRRGRTIERGGSPPDKSAFFWDYQRGVLWGSNDAMEWVEINSDDGMQAFEAGFSYLNFPSQNLLVSGDATRIVTVRIYIETPWDAPSPELLIGDVFDTDRFVEVGDVDLKTAGMYEIPCNHLYNTATTIRTTLDSDGSIQGIGSIMIIYDRRV